MAFNTIEFDKLRLKQGDTLLDVGCGLGRHSLMAYRDYPVSVYGVDISFEDLSTAKNRLSDIQKQNCNGRIIFAQANGFSLPFAPNSFDVVMCSEVLEHIPAYEHLLGELIRVLKPQGRLALSVPKYFPEKLCWLLSDKYSDYAGHVRIFKGRELPKTVCGQGMRLIEKHSAHALHSPYWWLRSLYFDKGESFPPTRYYKGLMDWQLLKAPSWTQSLEGIFNPLLGKSNVYYFEKPE